MAATATGSCSTTSAASERRDPWRLLLPALIATVATTLGAITLTDAVQVADSAELVTAACRLGVAHPPGYPLHTLLGHVFCQLPWSTPAARLSLLSLVAAVWAVLTLYALVVHLTGNRAAAAIAALALCTGSHFWRLASQPETRTLNVALVLSVVYASLRLAAATKRGAPGSPITPSAPSRAGGCALVGLLCGLALSNHHTSATVLPLAALAVLWPPGSLRRALRRSLAATAGLVAGLLPHVHLLLVPREHLPRWGETHTVSGLLHHLLRRDYGSLSLSIEGDAGPLDNLWAYLAGLPQQLGWVLVPFAAVGLTALLWRRPAGSTVARVLGPRLTRPHAVALVAVWLLAGPALMLLFEVSPQGIGRQIVTRFHLLPNALLCVALGVGLALADERLLRGTAGAARRIWIVAVGAAVALGALAAFPRADVSQSYTVEDYAENVLRTVEPGALVLGTGDVRLFSLMHAQQLLGERPDVQYVDAWLLLHRWYVDQQRRGHPGFSYRHRPRHVDTVGLIRRELRRGRPVYLAAAYNHKVVDAFQVTPVGPLLRLRPKDAPPVTTAELIAHNELLFRRFRQRGPLPDPAVDPWSAMLCESYAHSWHALARALHDAGDARGATELLQRGQRWAPWLQPPDWLKPGKAG